MGLFLQPRARPLLVSSFCGCKPAAGEFVEDADNGKENNAGHAGAQH